MSGRGDERRRPEELTELGEELERTRQESHEVGETIREQLVQNELQHRIDPAAKRTRLS